MLIPARVITATIVVWALLGAGHGEAAPYVFDGMRAEVRFSYSLPFSTGQGRFTGLSGMVDIDDATIENSTADVIIDTRTLRASTSMAESELRGNDFFAVATHPQMHFRSRSIQPKSATSSHMTGDMTIKGITRPIVLQVTLQPPALDGSREFRATTLIRRGDFGMTAYAFLVGEMVQIEIRAILLPVR